MHLLACGPHAYPMEGADPEPRGRAARMSDRLVVEHPPAIVEITLSSYEITKKWVACGHTSEARTTPGKATL
jgi:hypothetical protein